MAGGSLTLTRLDDELIRLWDAPVHTAGAPLALLIGPVPHSAAPSGPSSRCYPLNEAPKVCTYSCRDDLVTIMPRTAVTSSERLNLRLNPAAKRRIEQAAAFAGTTVSGFILSSALATAERTIREHETMVLSRRDAEVFVDAILNPPRPSAKLGQALEEHRRRVVSR